MSAQTAVKERPVVLRAKEVRAVLAGTKMQLRRIVKPQPPSWAECVGSIEEKFSWSDAGTQDCATWPIDDFGSTKPMMPPLGKPGDHLWVRETFQPLFSEKLGAGPLPSEYDYETGLGYKVSYPATDGIQEYYDASCDEAFCSRMTPSIHMPRWASRITLEITDVRVQRLQKISEGDASWEGVYHDIIPIDVYLCPYPSSIVIGEFAAFWNQINGEGSWQADPWVWAYTFKRVHA